MLIRFQIYKVNVNGGQYITVMTLCPADLQIDISINYLPKKRQYSIQSKYLS